MKKFLSLVSVGLRELAAIAIAVAVGFGGYYGFQYLGENREIVEAAPVERPITLVETAELTRFTTNLPIRGEGFVQPFRLANLASQVGGQVTELHPAITQRGRFKEGDVLARLDDSAERATITQTAANIEGTQARLDLNTILLERTESLRASGTTSQAALDQVKSQQAELSASLNSLLAAQKSAEVALSRKTVVAPFDGAVLSKSVEIGTVVSGGQAIAEIFTLDRMEVEVPVREADAALIPGLFEGEEPAATVSIRFAGRDLEWDATVTRVASALDPRTRTLTVSVELDNVAGPRAVGTDQLASGAPPALINSFAKVVIQGYAPENAYPVPSTALRGGDRIWLYEPAEDETGVLRIAEVDLIHVDGETSYVRMTDIPPNARLITTALSTPQPGMQLRDVETNTQIAAAAATTPE